MNKKNLVEQTIKTTSSIIAMIEVVQETSIFTEQEFHKLLTFLLSSSEVDDECEAGEYNIDSKQSVS